MLMHSHDTHKDKLFTENKGKCLFIVFFLRTTFFESLYFVHYHLHSSAVCTEDEADEEISIHIFQWKLMNKECC